MGFARLNPSYGVHGVCQAVRQCQRSEAAKFGVRFTAGTFGVHSVKRAFALRSQRSAAMTVILVLLVTFALGYGAYRIIRNGFRYPQSEKLNAFGIFGYFVLIMLGVWLATTVFNRFF